VGKSLIVNRHRLRDSVTGSYRCTVGMHYRTDTAAATRPCPAVEVQMVGGDIEASDGRDIGTGAGVDKNLMRKTIGVVRNVPEPCEGMVLIVRDDLASGVAADIDSAEVHGVAAAADVDVIATAITPEAAITRIVCQVVVADVARIQVFVINITAMDVDVG